MEANYAQDGIARGVWKVDEKFINGIGVAMGGFVTSAADIMMAYAISSKLSMGQSFASIDLHTTFHRPVRLGDVQVEAKSRPNRKKNSLCTSRFISK
ncbi:PaaI family thioesterase [Peribacillus frigoritolerans]|nr:PaaI family thioesterase [Peribacillus frigoritolerans]